MKPWEDALLRINDYVRDNRPELGRGKIVKLYPFGADIKWDRGGESFLGFHWIDRALTEEAKAAFPFPK
jgi:hypothetical protein